MRCTYYYTNTLPCPGTLARLPFAWVAGSLTQAIDCSVFSARSGNDVHCVGNVMPYTGNGTRSPCAGIVLPCAGKFVLCTTNHVLYIQTRLSRAQTDATYPIVRIV